MPRAPGAQPVVGGQMDPSTLRSMEQEKQFRQQKELAAMQAQTSIAQAQIGAEATLKAAEMKETGAGKRATESEAGAEKRTGMQVEAGREQTAMQIEADDRREAERIRGKEEDRRFMIEFEQEKQRLKGQQWQVEKDWFAAEKADDRAWQEKNKKERVALTLSLLRANRDKALALQTGMLGIMKSTMQTETQRAKEEQSRRREIEKRGKYRTTLGIRRKSTEASITSNKNLEASSFPGTSRHNARKDPTMIDEHIDEAMSKELRGLGLPWNMTMQMLTRDNFVQLEELVAVGKEKGGLGIGDLENLKIVLDKAEAMFEAKKKEAKGIGWDKVFYERAHRRIVEANIKFDSLFRSDNEKVSSAYLAAMMSLNGGTGSDAMGEVSSITGLSDLDSIFGGMLKMWQGRANIEYDPENPFGDFLREEAGMNVEMLESFVGGE